MNKWLKRIKVRCYRWANTESADWALLISTFTDASLLPMPTSTFFLILATLNNRKVFKYLLLAVAGTLAGALTGYFIGHFALHSHGSEVSGTMKFLLNHIPGFSESVYNKIDLLFSKWNRWVLIFAAATPIPYGFFSISSGVFDIGILSFSLATIIGQGIRFMVLALATMKISTEGRKLILNKFNPAATITVIFVIIASLNVNAC